jgi:prevent-host-death family protein
MSEIGVHEAKTHLSRLLRRVAAGEEIVITSGGRPAARLVPIATRGEREVGFDRGRLNVPEDLDEPLPDDVLDAFERRGWPDPRWTGWR